MFAALAVALVIAHKTSFGADVYAMGGDRASAALMGVPMRATTVKVYALGGLYSAFGGVIYALYTSSGYPLAGSGTELSAIAAVVLGGTLLTGGIGLVVGALFGGMILGLIATLINFNGSLNGAWIMISSGVLLFVFIVLQRALVGSLTPRGRDLERAPMTAMRTPDRPRRRRGPSRSSGPPSSATYPIRSRRPWAARSSAACIRPARNCPIRRTCAPASRSRAPLCARPTAC